MCITTMHVYRYLLMSIRYAVISNFKCSCKGNNEIAVAKWSCKGNNSTNVYRFVILIVSIPFSCISMSRSPTIKRMRIYVNDGIYNKPRIC